MVHLTDRPTDRAPWRDHTAQRKKEQGGNGGRLGEGRRLRYIHDRLQNVSRFVSSSSIRHGMPGSIYLRRKSFGRVILSSSKINWDFETTVEGLDSES